jgi:hypothetical protein
MHEARLGVDMHEARKMVVGGTIVMSSQYMLLTMEPLTRILLFMERKILLLPSVEVTLALSSWMPLTRFVCAAGMCRALLSKIGWFLLL